MIKTIIKVLAVAVDLCLIVPTAVAYKEAKTKAEEQSLMFVLIALALQVTAITLS